MKAILNVCLMVVLSMAFPPILRNKALASASSPVESRVALVIGNANYPSGHLRNPVNDARDIAQTLEEVGFSVIYKEDLTQREMKEAIRSFGERIRNGGVALFYYAGHGIQVNGQNYLVPTNAVINRAQEVEYECVDAGFVLAQMTQARINIVILDACRNNPFAQQFRDSTRGLSVMTAPGGTLIAYATAPGSVASDGNGDHGLYTQELLKKMRVPGLSIEQVFKRVRAAVIDETHGKQTPWESSSLVGDFYFTDRNRRKPADVGTSNGTAGTTTGTVATNEAGDRLEIIEIRPAPPAQLIVGEKITVKIAYRITSPKGCAIWVLAGTPGTTYQASAIIPRGSGVVERYFRLTKKGEVDRIFVQMGERNSDGTFNKVLILRADVKAYFDEQ